jgi:hypothetical protein
MSARLSVFPTMARRMLHHQATRIGSKAVAPSVLNEAVHFLAVPGDFAPRTATGKFQTLGMAM